MTDEETIAEGIRQAKRAHRGYRPSVQEIMAMMDALLVIDKQRQIAALPWNSVKAKKDG